MAAIDAKPIPIRNQPLRLTFPIRRRNSENLVSGAVDLDSEVSKDGALFVNCVSEAVEIDSSGVYFLDLTASEMDARTVVVSIKADNPARTTVITLYPQELSDIKVWDVPISQLDIVGSIGDAMLESLAEIETSIEDVNDDVLAVKNSVSSLDASIPGIRKSLPFPNFCFFLALSSDHVSPAPGLLPKAFRSLNAGAFSPCENPVIEIASGFYKIDLSMADTNGNLVALKFEALGADSRIFLFLTRQ